ncbi:MAG: UPF0146 family protein [Methanocalculus sp.]|uniref:UPF0146 family protein n=1 Tax=Methanocalculus sp. TaxID=2004547 RepID=UPI0027218E85|nr:UPF0146 family protein [Methanocalculus sp.]MDO8841322.1 UPF0146 family protein [Methanocalculus sp.]MDO9538828.1 UPF0146 family protein [Methanocalculus sp.]
MSGYKHIEENVGRFIGKRYRRVVEIGYGGNIVAALMIRSMGASVLCIDIRPFKTTEQIRSAVDDISNPDLRLYRGADCIYAIRPGVEMMPDLLAIAEATGSDLLVYHLGCEIYESGGEIIDCGVILHRYYPLQKEKRVD